MEGVVRKRDWVTCARPVFRAVSFLGWLQLPVPPT